MSILIIGSGICGLGAALLLARDGHDVTVLERDGSLLPRSAQEAWDGWTRPGVVQFRQPHNFMPGLRELLEAELPDLQDALQRAGASRFDLLNPLPPTFADRSSRPIDDRLWTFTARRPVGEWVFLTAALNEPRITVRRGEQVAELLSGPSASDGIPHVAGVRTAGGETLAADVVVDASGRLSRSPLWLAALGARQPYEEQMDCGFAYYTRYFTGAMPARRAGALTPLGSISILTLPGDNDTWSITLFCASNDQPLKALRHGARWTNTVRACPAHAHWLDGEPITGVLPMSGVVDRYRRFAADDGPVATGFVAIGDAWACTNPSAGRGLTVGVLHARQLRDVLRDAGDEPRRFVDEFDRRTETDIAPWYHAQIAVDRARFAEMEALRDGREPPPVADELARAVLSLMSAMPADPDLFRAALEYIGTITPVQDILARRDVAEKVGVVRAAMKDTPPPRMPGPDRAQLLDIVR